MVNIFVGEEKESMSDKEILALIQLARKFFLWRKSDAQPGVDEVPVAWLDGSCNNALVRIVVSDHPEAFSHLNDDDDYIEGENRQLADEP